MLFPELHLLTDDGEHNDYRPAIGPTGEVVIFERTPRGGGKTVLYQIADFRSPDPKPFLSDPSAPPLQTRPDWNWRSNQIAFNGAPAAHEPISVWVAGRDGKASQLINTDGLLYPTWTSQDDRLVASNYSSAASPQPCNSIFDASGVVHIVNINGDDTKEKPMYGGMPAVKPGQRDLIAFAGQPKTPKWVKTDGDSYNQAFNYIFLNAADNDGRYSSRPMEPNASVRRFDEKYQGRAPAWSPDGRTIAFESNRSRHGYAIYLCDVESGSITQVTDPALGAQHAKLFPCGTKLVLCVQPQDTWSIAWIDVSIYCNADRSSPMTTGAATCVAQSSRDTGHAEP